MSTVPFSISVTAAAWLARVAEKVGEEPGFVSSPRYGVYRGTALVEDFRREHYAFVHADPIIWQSERSAIQVMLGGRVFWLTPDVLENLAGKMLEVVRAEVGRDIFREFLVARLPDAKTA